MKHLKRFDEAFGQNGMFDWKVADMKHTPSSRAQLGLDKESDEVCPNCDCIPCQCNTDECKECNCNPCECEGMNEGLDDHFREMRVNSYLRIARDKYKGKSADEIIDIIDKGNPGLRFMDDQEKELFRQEWDKENKKGTFKYFIALSNDELKDYQKNFTHHGFDNPAEHNPEYVAWKKACEIKKVFVEKKEYKREIKDNNFSRRKIY